MTALAFGAKCGFFGARASVRGPADAPSRATAIPAQRPRRPRGSRGRSAAGCGMKTRSWSRLVALCWYSIPQSEFGIPQRPGSFPRDELVQVHQHAGRRPPTPSSGRPGASRRGTLCTRSASAGVGVRAKQSGTRTPPGRRRRPGRPSRSACPAPSANSTNAGSFARCRACSGVLLRLRRVQAVWASAPSNVVSSGCWLCRQMNVYMPAAVAVRALCSPATAACSA